MTKKKVDGLEQYRIARETVLEFIKTKKSFLISTLEKEIKKRGGFLRVSVGVTVRDYLEDFHSDKVIEIGSVKNTRFRKEGRQLVTVIYKPLQ